MADISKITLPNGSTYDVKDATARTQISSEAATRQAADDSINNTINSLKSSLTGAMHYVGETSTALTDGSDTSPIKLVTRANSTIVGDTEYTPKPGDVVIYQDKEFVYSKYAGAGVWHEFGSTGSFKALAFKDSASGSVTPSGTVSKPTFTGTAGTVNVTGEGFIDDATIEATVAVYGPNGYNPILASPNSTKINLNTHISGGSVTITQTTDNIKQVKSVGTLPTFSATVNNETLSFNFNAGSLPTTTDKSVVTGVTSTLTNPTVEVSPFSVDVILSQDTKTLSGLFTPQGTISQPTFKGNASTVTVK